MDGVVYEDDQWRGPFGLKGMPVMKLREIGEVLGISHEWVRQLEARAMKKMAVGQTEVRELYKFVTGKEW